MKNIQTILNNGYECPKCGSIQFWCDYNSSYDFIDVICKTCGYTEPTEPLDSARGKENA